MHPSPLRKRISKYCPKATMENLPHRWNDGSKRRRIEHNDLKQGDAASAPFVQPQLERRYQPNSKFMDLPLDLTFMIFDHLDARDSTALSLTCRGLFDSFFAKARKRFHSTDMWDHSRTRLMLEHHAPPHVIYCYFCAGIHTVDKEYRRTSCLERKRTTSSCFDTQLVGGGAHKLMFIDARVAVNAAKFNKPGAEKLLESLRWKGAEQAGTSRWTHQIEARITNSGRELILEKTSTHVHPDQPFDEFTYSVCKHVHIYAKHPFIFADSRKFDSKGCPGDALNVGSSCAVCGAQWDIKMGWYLQQPETAAREGWGLAIWSRHFLGQLHIPSCRTWARCAGEYEAPDVKRMIERRQGGWDRIYRDLTWSSAREQKAGS